MTMSEDRLNELISDDKKFREFVIKQFLVYEHRMTKVEVRSGIIGFLGGLIPGLVFYLRIK